MHPEATYPQTGTSAEPAADMIQTVVKAAILCALAAMAIMSFTRNINWDEFFFLSHVHANLNGTLDRPMQTAYVHAFGWLSWIPGTEVDQIVVARIVMLGLFSTTCFAVYRIALSLADQTSAYVAVLAFVTSGFAIAHGNSFRADPIAASLLICAVAIMMTSRMNTFQIIAVAAFSACALLVTIKSAMYLPVYLAALVWRWDDRTVVVRSLGAGVLALIIAAPLFLWHTSGITAAAGTEVSAKLTDAAVVTLGGNGFLPRWPELALWLMFSAGAVMLASASLFFAPTRRLQAVLILFAVPLLSVVVYRNAFPYFFPFAVAPFMVAVAVGVRALHGGLVAKLAIVLMLASGVIQTQRAFSEGNAAQRATIAEVHRIFPQSAPYIDQNGMMSSFERLGFFMSTWGLASYRAAGQPVFADLIAHHNPPLLLANRDALHAVMRPNSGSPADGWILPQDAATLRASYVHHAGVIWLAGKDVTLTLQGATVSVPFAGRYRIETPAPVTFGDQTVINGDVLDLDSNPVTLTGPAHTKVRVVWHTGAGPATITLPETGLYAGFWRL